MQRRFLANGASKPAPAPPAGDVTHLRAAAPLVDVPPICGVLSTLIGGQVIGGSTWKPRLWSQRKALSANSLREITET